MFRKLSAIALALIIFALPVCMANAEDGNNAEETDFNICALIGIKNDYAFPETKYDTDYFNSKMLCGADDTVTAVERRSDIMAVTQELKLYLSPSKQDKESLAEIEKELLADTRISGIFFIAEDKKDGALFDPSTIVLVIKDDYTAPENVYDTAFFNGIVSADGGSVFDSVESLDYGKNKFFSLKITEPKQKNINKIISELSKNERIDSAGKNFLYELPGYVVYSRGDVDLNEKINSSDARTVLRATAKLDTLNYLQDILADVNGDGNINTADAREILLKTIMRTI